jgi:hypothetical protein
MECGIHVCLVEAGNIRRDDASMGKLRKNNLKRL